MNIHRGIVAVLLLASACAAPGPLRAAQSYANCTGFIDALPATISTGGTWCLRKDLATNIATGSAINVQSNDAVIDCNDFKIGGLAAGNASMAAGISALTDSNLVFNDITIRHCNIRGFHTGIELPGSYHLVEDNRLDNNLYMGILVGRTSSLVNGEHNLVRRNAVYDTGGALYGGEAYGMFGTADFSDNIIDGMFGTSNTMAGIVSLGTGAEVSRNRISGLSPSSGPAFGIRTNWYRSGSDNLKGDNQTISDNRISTAATGTDTIGAGISGQATAFCSGNTIGLFATKTLDCTDDGGNASL